MLINENRIKIAVQKRGRLRVPSFDYLNSIGLYFGIGESNDLIVSCQNAPVDVLLVRNRDIPEYVRTGAADFGIVGLNTLYERDECYPVTNQFEFGRCSLVIAASINSGINLVTKLQNKRIATSYPNSLRRNLNENGIIANVIEINGSVEIAPLLNIADAVCDITQTGDTLRKYGLKPLATILRSQAVMIEGANRNNVDSFKEKYIYASNKVKTI